MLYEYKGLKIILSIITVDPHPLRIHSFTYLWSTAQYYNVACCMSCVVDTRSGGLKDLVAALPCDLPKLGRWCSYFCVTHTTMLQPWEECSGLKGPGPFLCLLILMDFTTHSDPKSGTPDNGEGLMCAFALISSSSLGQKIRCVFMGGFPHS